MIQIKEIGNYLLIDNKLASKGKWEFQKQGDGKWDVLMNGIIILDGIPYTDFEDEFFAPFGTNDLFQDYVCSISGVVGAGTSTGGAVPVPLDVTETNPLSLGNLENSLLNVITELQSVNADTDTIVANLTTIINSLSDIDTNTDEIESKINSSNYLLDLINTSCGLIRSAILVTNTTLDSIEDDVEALYNKSTTATVTAITVNNTPSTTLVSSSATRKKTIIENNGNNTIYVKFGATASITDFSFKLAKNEIWEELNYQGIITAVTSSGTSSVNVTSM